MKMAKSNPLQEGLAELNAYIRELTRPRWSKRRRAMRSTNFTYHEKHQVKYLNSHEGFKFEQYCGEDGTFAIAIDYEGHMLTYMDLSEREYIEKLYEWVRYRREKDEEKEGQKTI